jgi:hypothetical protein
LRPPARGGELSAELGHHGRPRFAEASSGARPRPASLRPTPDPDLLGLAPAPVTGTTCDLAGAIAHPMRPDGRVQPNCRRRGRRESPRADAGLDPRAVSPPAGRHPPGVEHTALLRRSVGTERFRRRCGLTTAVAFSEGKGARPRNAVWCRTGLDRDGHRRLNHPGAACNRGVGRPRLPDRYDAPSSPETRPEPSSLFMRMRP